MQKLLSSDQTLRLPEFDRALPVPFPFEDTKETHTNSPFAADTTVDLFDYWRIFKARIWTFAPLASIGLAIGLGIAWTRTPLYTARETLEVGIDAGSSRSFDGAPVVNPAADETYLPTQIKLIESDSVLKRVVRRLDLTHDPALTRRGPVEQKVRKWLSLNNNVEDPSEQYALRYLSGHLKARPSGQTHIIEILFNSPDPELSAKVVNTVGEEYVNRTLDAHASLGKRTNEWLDRQLAEVKASLEKSEYELQHYAESADLIYTTTDKDSVDEEKLRQTQTDYSKAQADRMNKQSEYEMAVQSPPDALPEVLDSKLMLEYRARLSELRRQFAELSSDLTALNPNVKRIQAEIDEVEGGLNHERSNIVRRIANEADAAKRNENSLGRAYQEQLRHVSNQGFKKIRYELLRRDVDTNRALYETVLQKTKQSHMASAMQTVNAQVVDAATPPAGPSSPNKPLLAALGILSGSFLGLLVVLVQEHSDSRLSGPGFSARHLKLRELGVIPSARADKNFLPARVLPNVPLLGDGKYSEAPEKQDCIEMMTWRQKPSQMAEAFRSTLTSILFSAPSGQQPRVLTLTSPHSGEGKTTTVSNLGIALAEIYRKVLIIDADQRCPRIHDVFDVPNSWGLSDILRERTALDTCPLEGLARETEVPGLYVMPSGPAALNGSNLLFSERFKDLLRRLKREFDMIIIDTPPLMLLPDARVVGRLSDGVVLVLRNGKTTREAATSARQRLTEDSIPILGTVLNDFDFRNLAPGSMGYYGYGAPKQ